MCDFIGHKTKPDVFVCFRHFFRGWVHPWRRSHPRYKHTCKLMMSLPVAYSLTQSTRMERHIRHGDDRSMTNEKREQREEREMERWRWQHGWKIKRKDPSLLNKACWVNSGHHECRSYTFMRKWTTGDDDSSDISWSLPGSEAASLPSMHFTNKQQSR